MKAAGVRLSLAVFAIATLATAQIALGQTDKPDVERSYSKTYNDCMAAAGGSTMPSRDCQKAEIDRWDAQLNAIYRQRFASADATGKARLRDDERAWLKRITRKCDHAGDGEAGGTLQPIEIDDCYLAEKVARTLELRRGR